MPSLSSVSFIFRNVINQPFRLCPAKAGVGDGLAVNAFADLLAALLDITLDLVDVVGGAGDEGGGKKGFELGEG